MPNEIKTKTTVRDIKVLAKVANGTAHTNNAFISSKPNAEATQDPQHHSAGEYASDHVTNTTKDDAEKTAHHISNPQNKINQNVNKNLFGIYTKKKI